MIGSQLATMAGWLIPIAICCIRTTTPVCTNEKDKRKWEKKRKNTIEISWLNLMRMKWPTMLRIHII